MMTEAASIVVVWLKCFILWKIEQLKLMRLQLRSQCSHKGNKNFNIAAAIVVASYFWIKFSSAIIRLWNLFVMKRGRRNFLKNILWVTYTKVQFSYW